MDNQRTKALAAKVAKKIKGGIKCIDDNGLKYTFIHGLEKILRRFRDPKYGCTLVKRSRPVIITLTSYPARIKLIHSCIETLLAQTFKPDKVVLWLAIPQFPRKEGDLPVELLNLCKRGLEIRWCRQDLKSYKKIIPALKAFPKAILVTADDDLLYSRDWLKLLMAGYKKHPNDINIHRATKLFWTGSRFLTCAGGRYFYPNASAMNKICSGAGAVFPPGSLHSDVLRKDLFLKLAPTSDDIWLWAMAVINGWRVRVVEGHQAIKYVPGSQDCALCRINDTGPVPLFQQHLQNVCAQYPEFKARLVADFMATQASVAAEGFNFGNGTQKTTLADVMSPQYEFDNFRSEIRKSLDVLKSQITNTYADLRYIIFKYLPPEKREEAIKDWWYKMKAGMSLNIETPQTFDEKIQWLKLHGEDPLLTRLADKYEVRPWVAEKIGEKYLVPLLGVWDSADDINFNELPDKFVLKANHGCGWNVIVRDKSKIKIPDVRRRINVWLKTNFAFKVSFEMQYSNIKPKVIAEEYMENDGGDIYDYKFWCFKGKCHYIQFLSERQKHLKMVFFDRDWKIMPFVNDHMRNEAPPSRPDNLDEMIRLAETLAEGFEYVRVDFYRLNDGTIKFGEMTFTTANGQCKWDPPEWDLKLGSLFDVRPGNRMAEKEGV